MTETRPSPALETDVADILFFGAVADIFGRRLSLPIPGDGVSLAELRRRLSAVGGEGVFRAELRFAVDQVLIHGEATVRPGQQVAVMSPFSGG